MGERLPEGWEWKRLGELGKIESGGTPRRGKQEYWKDGSIPWVKISDISDKYILKTSEKITKEGFENSSAKMFSKGSLLISIFATLGDVGILNIDAACNQALASIQLNNNNVDRDYLYYLLKSLKKHFEKIGRGVAQNNINLTILKSTKIPLPPLETQHKIVAILEKADETKRLRMQADGLTTQLLQSVFLEMFGDLVNNPKRWKISTLESVCSELYRYPTFYGFEYSKTGVPVVRIGNICSNGSLDPDVSNYVFIESKLNENFPRTILEFNDIVMAVRGDGSTAKRIGLVNTMNLVGANMSPNLIRFKTKNKILNPLFLFNLMISDGGQRLLEKYVTRTAKKTITAKDIKKILIPIPPLPLQQKFAQIVENVEAMRQNQKQSQQEIDNLFNALMQKAFKGELTT